MNDFLPATLAIVGLVMVFVLPLRWAALMFTVLLGGLLALTLIDLALNRQTASDIGCFGLALVVGGFGMLTRVDSKEKE